MSKETEAAIAAREQARVAELAKKFATPSTPKARTPKVKK